MLREALTSCIPWIIVLGFSLAIARGLILLMGLDLRIRRLARLHASEEGSVQSLSFVLTLPLLIAIVMLIVQCCQIMVGNILVHYAAFASARSAIVWIPANLG